MRGHHSGIICSLVWEMWERGEKRLVLLLVLWLVVYTIAYTVYYGTRHDDLATYA